MEVSDWGLFGISQSLISNLESLQLSKQVGEDRVAPDHARVADQVALRVVAPCLLGGQNWAVNQRRLDPGWLDQPGDRADIPDLLGAGVVLVVVAGIDLEQIVADRALALDKALHLGLGRAQMLGHVDARYAY